MAEAIRSAERRGYDARRDGLKREACPFKAQALRAAWVEGWLKADKEVF